MASGARTLLFLVVGFASLGSGGLEVEAQNRDLSQEIRESQRRLEQIREERARLQREVGDVRNRVRDAAAELENVERRLSASRSVLAEVEFQSEATAEQVQATTVELVQSQERLAESEAVLFRRLRDIYKMGPMHTVQVLLGARSFTDLLNRYRYLQRIASFDRTLVERVTELESELAQRNDELRERMSTLGALRQDRLSEVARLRSVEEEHQRSIQQYRAREETATDRIAELSSDETRMSSLIGELEERRRELDAVRNRMAGAGVAAEDRGTLDWPVEGELVYRFGPERRPNGTVVRWNGIGIRAAPGTPVQAVRGGIVAYAARFEGYGPTVILDHGGGVYTLYAYLEEIGVVQGRTVDTGQIVGTVGGADTPEGARLEFQIRIPDNGGSPQAQDPLPWLRARGGA